MAKDLSVTLKLTSCVDCPHHRVERDPDPDDWFCDDDVKVVCLLTKRQHNTSTVACRPYNTRKETSPPPDWCPLRKQSPTGRLQKSKPARHYITRTGTKRVPKD